jgi:hypothetical protein
VESLTSKKKDPWKKEEEGLKSKRGETSYEELHVTKKVYEIYKLLGEILSEERKKGDHIFL